MKRIGIAAHSAEGAALCFRTICAEGARALGPHDHPDVTLDIEPMAHAMPAWDAGDYAPIRGMFARSIERLARADCDFFLCPDNTAHLALEMPGEDFALPGLHIAEVVADRAVEEGCRSVGILGTRYTMNGPIYPRVLRDRGITAVIPDEADQQTIHAVIFDELVNGIFLDASREQYVAIIRRLAERGCDAVALVCTEIPLLVTPETSPLLTLDSTRLLARAALDVAMGKRAMPEWRGGHR